MANELELASNKMEQVRIVIDRIVSYLRTGSFPSSMAKNEKILGEKKRRILWLSYFTANKIGAIIFSSFM